MVLEGAATWSRGSVRRWPKPGSARCTPLLGADARFRPIVLPFADELRGVPVLGPIYAELISNHNILVYVAAAVPVVAWVVYRTRFGLRLRAVGEIERGRLALPGSASMWMRYKALVVTGLLCGIAGAYLSIAHNASFIRDMTAGKGYLALAALIFGKRPVPALFACFLFAFTDAVQIRLQGVPLPLLGTVPTQAIQALPYLATVLLLAGFVGRAIAPQGDRQPYVKRR